MHKNGQTEWSDRNRARCFIFFDVVVVFIVYSRDMREVEKNLRRPPRVFAHLIFIAVLTNRKPMNKNAIERYAVYISLCGFRRSFADKPSTASVVCAAMSAVHR